MAQREESGRVLRRRRLVIALAVALLVAAGVAVGTGVTGRSATTEPTDVTVMTRNLYLGGDITRPVRAAQGQTGVAALLALGHAADALRTVVDQTDFPSRARLLAAELAESRPDLAGLQEVALWRHGPLQLDQPGRLDATEVDLDFLALLLGELDTRGLPYDVVATQDESDVEAPAFRGDPRTGNDPTARDVRLTMRDVVLVRRGSGIEVTGTGTGQYAHRIDVDLGGVAFSFIRGYAWADVRVAGSALRFVTTQLESQSPAVAEAQAQELIAGPLAVTGRPVVLGCDCNSGPTEASDDGRAAYGLLVGSGLADAWVAQPDGQGTGATCCLGERVDARAPDFDRRIDLVLSRGAITDRAELVGSTPAERDPASGLWAADHAGLVAHLRLG